MREYNSSAITRYEFVVHCNELTWILLCALFRRGAYDTHIFPSNRFSFSFWAIGLERQKERERKRASQQATVNTVSINSNSPTNTAYYMYIEAHCTSLE